MIIKLTRFRVFWHRLFWSYSKDPSGARFQIHMALDHWTGTVLARFDGGLVGALNYIETEEGYHITHLGSIQPGTGTELVNRVLAGGKIVTLNCRDHNITYYQRFGFKLAEVLSPNYNLMRYTPADGAGPGLLSQGTAVRFRSGVP